MNICFIEEYSIINHDYRIKLGKLTCEQLNGATWDEHHLLGAQLDFFLPQEYTTAAQFLTALENMQKTVERMKESLSQNRYYQLNDEATNTFTAIQYLLDDARKQIEDKIHSPDEYVLDSGIEIDDATLQKASAYFDALYMTHAEAVRVFTQLVDAIMVLNDAFPQRSPIDRLHAFGFDRFRNAVGELVREYETAASSAYVPDFDMVTLPDGTMKIAPVVSINTIAQLMYHEIMNMIMQGHSIRKCKNCGRYFVQYGDRVVDYCEEIPEGETKPCTIIGPSRQFTASLKEDPLKQTYTRVYKKYIARRRAQTVTDGQFVAWAAEAKKLRAHAYETGMHEATFREKLDELMDDIVRNT